VGRPKNYGSWRWALTCPLPVALFSTKSDKWGVPIMMIPFRRPIRVAIQCYSKRWKPTMGSPEIESKRRCPSPKLPDTRDSNNGHVTCARNTGQSRKGEDQSIHCFRQNESPPLPCQLAARQRFMETAATSAPARIVSTPKDAKVTCVRCQVKHQTKSHACNQGRRKIPLRS